MKFNIDQPTKFNKLILFFISLLVSSCASTYTPNHLFYSSTDNENVTLLELDYNNHLHHLTGTPPGIYRISRHYNDIGKIINIEWLDRSESKKKTATIELNEGLPFNTNNAEIRLTFNILNQPEVYILYKNPDQLNAFWFKGEIYRDRLVRMIYPERRDIDIQSNQIR